MRVKNPSIWKTDCTDNVSRFNLTEKNRWMKYDKTQWAQATDKRPGDKRPKHREKRHAGGDFTGLGSTVLTSEIHWRKNNRVENWGKWIMHWCTFVVTQSLIHGLLLQREDANLAFAANVMGWMHQRKCIRRFGGNERFLIQPEQRRNSEQQASVSGISSVVPYSVHS